MLSKEKLGLSVVFALFSLEAISQESPVWHTEFANVIVYHDREDGESHSQAWFEEYIFTPFKTETCKTWDACIVSKVEESDRTLWYGHKMRVASETCAQNPDQPQCGLPDQKHECQTQPSTPNPISLATGRKFLNEVDYLSAGPHPFEIRRSYNYVPSLLNPVKNFQDLWQINVEATPVKVLSTEHLTGLQDQMEYISESGQAVKWVSKENQTFRQRIIPMGTDNYFVQDSPFSGQYLEDSKVPLGSTDWERSGEGTEGTHFELDITHGSGEIYSYEDGLAGDKWLTKITYPDGTWRRYENMPISATLYNYEVTDSYGKTLSLTWLDQQTAHLEDADGNITQYLFSAPGDSEPTLTVIYPDNTPADPTDNDRRVYVHHPVEDEHGEENILSGALKAIYDNGQLVLEYEYDPTTGQAIHSNKAGDEINSSYQSHDLSFDGNTTTVTNALGKNTVYHFENIGGAKQVVRVEGVPTSDCLASDSQYTYDIAGRGHVHTKTDSLGNVTEFNYNLSTGTESGRLVSMRTGLRWGTGDTLVETPETLTTTYHRDSSTGYFTGQPSKVVTRGTTGAYRETLYDYDSINFHRLLSITDNQRAENDDLEFSRVTTYSYTYHDPENILTQTMIVNGPLDPATQVDGVDDIETYHYDLSGRLIQFTNAYGQSTYYSDFTAHGHPQTVTDIHGVVTRLNYDARGRLLSSTIEHPSGDSSLNLVTEMDYNLRNDIIQMRLPGGQTLTYEYNSAGLLRAIANQEGERIEYTLDAEGNPIGESILNSSGGIALTLNRAYDALSRLTDITGAAGQNQHTDYDALDNPIAITGGRNNTTQQEYDSLQRLKRTIDPLLGETAFDYDPLGHLNTVTDARGLTTTYTHNVFGELQQRNSPDTGAVSYDYDHAGNRTRTTDHRGVITEYQYDALGRLLSVVFPASPSENITYGYDDTSAGNYGLGRLTSLVDPAGTTQFRYNHLGLMVSKTRLFDGDTFTTEYTYSPEGVLAGITYPSGRVVNYTLDSQQRIVSITTQDHASAATESVLSTVNYAPFGPVQSYAHANGLTRINELDHDYRTEAVTVNSSAAPLMYRDLNYDADNNITAIHDLVDTGKSQNFHYDALNRLIDAQGIYGDFSFSYDAVGNRREKTAFRGDGLTEDTYDYSASANQLNGIETSLNYATASESRHFSYDAAGNITEDIRVPFAPLIYAYNNAGQLMEVRQGSDVLASYVYNALNQRVQGITDEGNLKTHYFYDKAGLQIAAHTLSEDGLINQLVEYIYLGQEKVTMLVEQTDHRDFDGDGVINSADDTPHGTPLTRDSDGDGVVDAEDAFPFLASEWLDSDGDGIGDNNDAFDTDPTYWLDTDGDGYANDIDVFPNDPTEWADSDGNGIGDNEQNAHAANDQDGDGFSDRQEIHSGHDPANASDFPNIGDPMWSIDLGTNIGSATLGANGEIYVASYDKNLYSLDQDGQVVWTYTAGSGFNYMTPSVAPDGTLYAVSYLDRKLHAINPDGTPKWTFGVYSYVYDASPAIDADGTVYIGSGNRLHAINPDGSEKWYYSLTGTAYSAPSIAADGTIYIGTTSRWLFAINPDGTLKWQTKVNGAIYDNSPAIDSNGNIYVGANDDKLYAINPQGQILWTYLSGGDFYSSSPVIGADGTLYIGSHDKKLHAINPDGTAKWSYTTAGRVNGEITLAADGAIYFGSDDNKLYVLNSDGSLRRSFNSSSDIEGAPVFADDGTLYITLENGLVEAFVEDNQLANTPWPTFGRTTERSSHQCRYEDTYLSHASDSDSDGISDCHEYRNHLNWTYATDAGGDLDLDGLSNQQEALLGTHITLADSDFDGLNDASEINTHHTNPLSKDSDLDGVPDGDELVNGTNPNNMSDSVSDSDGDGFSDRQEALTGHNPEDASDFPAVGDLMWATDIGASYDAIAQAPDGTLYTASNEEPKLYAYSTGGLLKWAYTAGSHFYNNHPTISVDGTIYAASYSDKTLHAINPDGSAKWTFTLSGYVRYGSPAIGSDGTLYISTDSWLYAINPDGTEKWRFSGGSSSVPSIAADGTIYYTATNTHLYALHSDGTVKWSYDMPGTNSYMSPAIAADGTVYAASADDKLYAFDPNGTVLWTYAAGADFYYSSPVIAADGAIYIGSHDKKLHAVNPDGTGRWTFTTGGYIKGDVSLGADGTVYFGSDDNKLYAVNSEGALQWSYTASHDVISAPTLGADGTLFITSEDGVFHALVNTTPLATEGWPTLGKDLARRAQQ